jgi:hypothetical protein
MLSEAAWTKASLMTWYQAAVNSINETRKEREQQGTNKRKRRSDADAEATKPKKRGVTVRSHYLAEMRRKRLKSFTPTTTQSLKAAAKNIVLDTLKTFSAQSILPPRVGRFGMFRDRPVRLF